MASKLEEIKIHKEAIDSSSPLALIREKELEINAKVLQSKKEAEELVAKARQEAASMREKAVQAGIKEGKAAFDKEIERTKKEAEEIKKQSLMDIKSTREGGQKNFNKAVEMILKTILP